MLPWTFLYGVKIMLTLTRYKKEKIILRKGDEIIAVIRIEDVGTQKVKMNFFAERDIEIERQEIVPESLKKKVLDLIKRFTGSVKK